MWPAGINMHYFMMGVKICLCFVFCIVSNLLVMPCALAQPDVISGTYSAWDFWWHSHPHKISWVKVSISGKVRGSGYHTTVVRELHSVLEEDFRTSIAFDTTRFVDGSVVTLTIEAENQNGEHGRNDRQCVVRNRALVYSNQTLKNKIENARNACESFKSSGYSVVSKDASDAGDLLNRMPQYSVLYAYTHGIEGSQIWDCIGDTRGDGHSLKEDDVYKSVNVKTNNDPKYSFVCLFACQSGTHLNGHPPKLSTAYGINNNSINRAYVGFDAIISTGDKNAQWNKRFFLNLKNGFTVIESKQLSNAYGKPVAINVNANYFHEVTRQLTLETDAMITGDVRTKIRGLYGSPSFMQWYRVIR
jgi:hypothetical protein